MAVMSLDPTGAGRKRRTMRWKGAMNAFDLAFDGRLTAGQLQPHQTQLHRSLYRPQLPAGRSAWGLM
jgi:hypothetical protein